MSRVSRIRLYLQENPASCWMLFLEGSVRTVNFLLAAAGAAMCALSIVVWVHIHDTSQTSPWFVYAFGSAGLVTMITSLAALVGSSQRNVCCLNSNIVGMLLSLTVQACFATAFFMDHSWERHLPPDEQFDKLKEFIKRNLTVFKWVGVAIIGLQVLGLLFTCALQTVYVRLEEMIEDEQDAEVWRRRPLLRGQLSPTDGTAGPSQPSNKKRQDEWSQRMREQYQLDTSKFSYDPERSRAGNQHPEVAQQPPEQRCSIM